MNIREFINKLKSYDEDTEVVFVGWDEYGCEIEGLEFRDIEKSKYSKTIYINITQ